MSAVHLALSVTVIEPAPVIVLVAGLPGVAGEAAFVVDGSAVRLLWPVRCLLAREPERPIAPGLPSLSAIIRQAVG